MLIAYGTKNTHGRVCHLKFCQGHFIRVTDRKIDLLLQKKDTVIIIRNQAEIVAKCIVEELEIRDRGQRARKWWKPLNNGKYHCHRLTFSGLNICFGVCVPWLSSTRTTTRGTGKNINFDSIVEAGKTGQPSANGATVCKFRHAWLLMQTCMIFPVQDISILQALWQWWRWWPRSNLLIF